MSLSSHVHKTTKSKEVPHDRAVPYSRTANERKSVAEIVHGVFKKVAADVARQIRGQKLKKAAGDETDLDAHLVVDLSGLDELANLLPKELGQAYSTAGQESIAIVGGETNSDIVNRVNTNAENYARDRSAELVGKKWVDGELVDNPDAQWAIKDSTRNMLNSMVAQALDEGWGINKLADEIEASTASLDDQEPFSEGRARMIARTETIDAHNSGTLQGYRDAESMGVEVFKEWWPDDQACDICLDNAAAGPIPLDELFPSGDDAPTAHPNCECSLIPYTPS